ncbi:MCP four helix bundle domain-containing protein, partial [Hyphomicrobium sp.]|uniref:MCP four helix bundle domain-containing protein n=1 Tax=Hyphomicrobium sp. TaxID=82 RepID=UPI000F9A3791
MRFTIKTKLASTFSILTVLSAVMAGIAIYNLSSLNSQITDMISGPVKQQQLLSDLQNTLNVVARSEKNAALTNDAQLTAEFKKRAEEASAKVRGLIPQILAVSDGTVKSLIDGLQKSMDEYFALDQEVLRLASLNTAEANAQAGNISMGEGRKKLTAMFDIVDKVDAAAAQNMRDTDERTNDQYVTSRNLLTAATLILLLTSVGAAIWISVIVSRGLSKGVALAQAVSIGDLDQNVDVTTNDEIKDLIDAMNRMTANLRETALLADKVSNGDLTVEPKPLSDKDILGLALQRMVERLRSVVTDAIAASENVSSGSQQLSSASEQVSQGATEQASAAEEASASMEEMAANIKQNADNAAQT